MKNEETSIHSLNEYKQAKIMNKDMEEILIILDKFYVSMYNYSKYRDVAECLFAVSEAGFMIELRHINNKRILDKKARIKNED